MERRVSERKAVDVNVYVLQPGEHAVFCAASDISEKGVFLKTNPLYFPRSKRLNLVFALRLESSNVVRVHKVSAMVARSESDGIGMVFCRNKVDRT